MRDAAAPLGLEGVGDGLLEGHLSTDREGGGEVFLAECGCESVSCLLVQAALIGLGGVPGFLAQTFDRTHEPGRPLCVSFGEGERGQLSEAPDR